MFDRSQLPENEVSFSVVGAELQPWAVMALNNMVMSYITMAPMYRDLLGEDPFSPDALEKQLALILKLAHLVIEH
jgi:TetR/AcrR family transcriptional regulator